MTRTIHLLAILGAMAAFVAAFLATGSTATTARASAEAKPIRFAETVLFVEFNATDGDAGLHLELDGQRWARVAINGPDGRRILDVTGRGALEGYGLTALTFESSEPPFDEHPLPRFKKLFPEGVYQFSGTTVEGRELRGAARLTHTFPAGPVVTAPSENAVVPRDAVVIRWKRVNRPAGVKIVSQQVIVSPDGPGATLEIELPATATRLTVPAELVRPRSAYKVEVIAREKSGNQTITQVAFRTR